MPRLAIAPVIVLLLGLTGPAEAYVGPGLGLGVLGALVGAVFAVLLAVLGLIWYPVKGLLNKRRKAPPGGKGDAA
ncbi:hypothetical protein [Alkalilimnicola sp. S0819]|uniref:hypothetical protein n=1 Tax=Alkalilimnicola sp. S0819 TaxID=2613922 RepID=UPI0012626B04|nr:hypothetical protein [Alkalilimnicola sp. S0819]KAB7619691.1 hypothetical protein F3N43_12985 [Alkalilimnicola sp. S0819]MPQ17548.1 hypothetical protein [Alkalilimnicola sp. S0819]